MKWPSLNRNTLPFMASVTRKAKRDFSMCVLTFLALVVVSSPCSLCWFQGVIPKGVKKHTQMCTSQRLLNFWCKKTVTGTDVSPLQEVPEC